MRTTTLVIEVAGSLSGVLEEGQLASTLRCLGIVKDERLVKVKIIVGSLQELVDMSRMPRGSRWKGKQNRIEEWKRVLAGVDDKIEATGASQAVRGRAM